eukprot:s7374_g2.t1
MPDSDLLDDALDPYRNTRNGMKPIAKGYIKSVAYRHDIDSDCGLARARAMSMEKAAQGKPHGITIGEIDVQYQREVRWCRKTDKFKAEMKPTDIDVEAMMNDDVKFNAASKKEDSDHEVVKGCAGQKLIMDTGCGSDLISMATLENMSAPLRRSQSPIPFHTANGYTRGNDVTTISIEEYGTEINPYMLKNTLR